MTAKRNPVEPVEPPAPSYFSICDLPLDDRGYPLTGFSNPDKPSAWGIDIVPRPNDDDWQRVRQEFFEDMDRLHAAILRHEQALEEATAEYQAKAGQFHDSEAAPHEARAHLQDAKEAYAAARTVAALEAAEVALAQAEREQIIADRVLADTTRDLKAAGFKMTLVESSFRGAKSSLYNNHWLNEARESAIQQQKWDAARESMGRALFHHQLPPDAQPNTFYPRSEN